MKLLLVGGGAMAAEVAALAAERGHHCYRLYNPDDWPGDLDPTDAVVVHFGSGRLLSWLIDMCSTHHLPLIQGSTGVGDMAHFADRGILIINAPNLSLVMTAFMANFPALARALVDTGCQVRIVESHQASKRDVSGTALAIVRKIGLPESTIQSVRSPGAQQIEGVPLNHLGGHAHHIIYFRGPGGEDLRITIRINGRRAYAEGALAVARTLSLHRHDLEPGGYQLADIIHRLKIDP